MGHAQHDFFDADFGTFFKEGVEGRDHGFAAFEGETLLADEFGVEEFLEELGLVNAAEDAAFLIEVERGLVVAGLHAGLEPITGLHVAHMHIFHADGAAEGFFDARGDVAELHLSAALVAGQRVGGVEIGVGELEGFEREFRVTRRRRVERVEMSLEVAMGPMGVDVADRHHLFPAIQHVDSRGFSIGGGQSAASMTEGEALEKGLPRRVDQVGIGQPLLVERFEDLGAGAGGK